MKVIYCMLLMLLVSNVIKAQDLIILKDGTEIKSLVSEVLETQIKYKKFDNKLGPTYSVLKSKVSVIRYENGTQDVFSSEVSPNNSEIVRDILQTPAPKEQAEPKENQNLKNATQLAIVGKKVFRSGILLRNSEIQSILSAVPPAVKTYKSGRRSLITGNIVAGASAGIAAEGLLFLVVANSSSIKNGYGTYSSSYYSTIGTTTTVIGLGGMLVGILINSSGKHKMSEGINIYNTYLQKFSFNISPAIDNDGIGICLRF